MDCDLVANVSNRVKIAAYADKLISVSQHKPFC